jgi:pimeloyl-ACP methyl ester carboxylesterase
MAHAAAALHESPPCALCLDNDDASSVAVQSCNFDIYDSDPGLLIYRGARLDMSFPALKALRHARAFAACLVSGLILGLSGTAPARAAESPLPVIKRGYADTAWGQVHYRIATPKIPQSEWKTPLVFFHQSPLSSLEYGPLIAEMGRDRLVLAPDTPGQGGSDAPPREASIEEYAAILVEALKGLGFGPQKPFDLLGNHTGTSLAMEAALLEPKMVRQIVMTGMYMAPESQIQGDIDALPWPKNSVEAFEEMHRQLSRYSQRVKMDPKADAIWGELMIDSWRPLTRREDVHKAAFKYHKVKKERIVKVPQKVWMVGLNDPLLAESTQQSLKMFKNVEYVDMTQYRLDVFRTHAVEMANMLRDKLR